MMAYNHQSPHKKKTGVVTFVLSEDYRMEEYSDTRKLKLMASTSFIFFAFDFIFLLFLTWSILFDRIISISCSNECVQH